MREPQNIAVLHPVVNALAEETAKDVWSVSGTPPHGVKLALTELLQRPPTKDGVGGRGSFERLAGTLGATAVFGR